MHSSYSFLFLLFITTSVHAETVTTTDGRTIKLNRDGTYTFLEIKRKDNYHDVDIVDLELEPESWVGKLIRLSDVTISNKALSPFIYQHPTMTGVMITADGKKIPKSTRRSMLKGCYAVCENATVTGMFRKDSYRYTFEVHDVKNYLSFVNKIK
tara:strand:- start:915 stop:1376 length:462 start_codon:yes stop_codon:yes gene_type:complete